MNATEVTRRYHDMWNGRDADALVGCFTEDGIFCNPDTYPGIGGEALANFVKGVWAASPDFSIELLNAGEIQPGIVAHHWRIRGTHTGPGLDGSAPTGNALNFQGASIITVKGDKIRSDECYFDRKALENPKKESAEDQAGDVKNEDRSRGNVCRPHRQTRTGQRGQGDTRRYRRSGRRTELRVPTP